MATGECTEGGSRGRLPKRSTEGLLKHAGMGLEKLKLGWKLI